MIVLSIIGAIIGLVIPRIDNKNNQIKGEVRKFTTLTRQVRNMAKLQNTTYRLVLDLGEEGEKSTHQYWLESSLGEVLLAEKLEEAYEEANDKNQEKENVNDPNAFVEDKKILKGRKELPGGMIFESIELPGIDKPLTFGKVYIHFFPSGRVEEAAIHLKLDNFQWTLAIHPLTGKTDIAREYISLRDINNR